MKTLKGLFKESRILMVNILYCWLCIEIITSVWLADYLPAIFTLLILWFLVWLSLAVKPKPKQPCHIFTLPHYWKN